MRRTCVGRVRRTRTVRNAVACMAVMKKSRNFGSFFGVQEQKAPRPGTRQSSGVMHPEEKTNKGKKDT